MEAAIDEAWRDASRRVLVYSQIRHVDMAGHPHQRAFVEHPAKRKMARSGRRGGKTTGAAEIAVRAFLAGRRVQYGAPTEDQVGKFWHQVKWSLETPVEAGLYYKHEGKHIIEIPGTENRIRARTAFDADSWRGDYGDVLIYDEWQLCKPDAWYLVGAPMLMDNEGDAVFIYTARRGQRGQHAREMWKAAQTDPRWATFRWSSLDNPAITQAAIDEAAKDMTALAFRMEVLAEDIEDDPDALWNRDLIEKHRVVESPDLARIVVGVDPPGKETGAECGIVVAGRDNRRPRPHGYVLADYSVRGSPARWGRAVVDAYRHFGANLVVGETNHGGDMVEHTIRTVTDDDGRPTGQRVSYRGVHASRGKWTRAEPVASEYEHGRGHHVGTHAELEAQMTNWVPGDVSPDRLDAAVFAMTELLIRGGVWTRGPSE